MHNFGFLILYFIHLAGTTSLDRRPTTILISDIDAEVKEAVLAHFAKFGELVETTEVDPEDGRAVMIQYKTRREAETAMLKSNQFAERSLRLTWHTSSLIGKGNKNAFSNHQIAI